jgi:hypothetical protein
MRQRFEHGLAADDAVGLDPRLGLKVARRLFRLVGEDSVWLSRIKFSPIRKDSQAFAPREPSLNAGRDSARSELGIVPSLTR